MEMTDRKKQILKIVVEEYVAAAEPVGSKAIAQRMPGKISSATIRNELADLTEMGYLEQPHTSAGRGGPLREGLPAVRQRADGASRPEPGGGG